MITVLVLYTLYGLQHDIREEGLVLNNWTDTLIAVLVMLFVSYIASVFFRQVTSYRTVMNANEEVIQEKNEQLTQYIETNLQLENFAHIASHELKTPVRSVANYSALLKSKSKEKLSEEELRYLDEIKTKAESMYKLTNDLLDLSKISSAKLQRQKIDLPELIDLIVKGLALNTDRLEVLSLPREIEANPKLIQYGLTRLIKMCIHACSMDNEEAKVTISGYAINGGWIISVSDNVTSVSDKDLISISLPMDDTMAGDVDVMPFMIAQRIAEKHNGTFSIQVLQPVGVSMEIFLPSNNNEDV